MLKAGAALALLLLQACSEGEPDVAVTNGWARATAPGQTTAAAYLTVANRGDGGDRIVAVQAPAAAGAALHSSETSGGVARMRPLSGGMEIAAGSTVEMKPHGTHVMISGLTQPLRAGDQFALDVTFERSGARRAAIRVEPAAASGPAHHGMRM